MPIGGSMFSGAQTDPNQETVQRSEEELNQGTQDQVKETESEWKDLNPDEYDPQLKDQVVNLNKAAVTQFQNKVRELREQGKLTESKLKQLEAEYNEGKAEIRKWFDDPENFLAIHRKTRPDYWAKKNQSNDQTQMTVEDKQAIEALRKAGLITKEELNQFLVPILNHLQAQKAEKEARSIEESQKEIDDWKTWCKTNNFPYEDKHARACFALIANGDASNMQEAYEQLFKSSIDSNNQKNLLHKKESQLTKPGGKFDTKSKDESLDDIVSQVVKGQ